MNMKKAIILSVGLAILLSGGCRKNPLNPLNAAACASNAQKVSDAALKFSSSPTNANCEAYKKEIVAFVKSCPAYYTAVEKKELEEFAKEPCDIEEN